MWLFWVATALGADLCGPLEVGLQLGSRTQAISVDGWNPQIRSGLDLSAHPTGWLGVRVGAEVPLAASHISAMPPIIERSPSTVEYAPRVGAALSSDVELTPIYGDLGLLGLDGIAFQLYGAAGPAALRTRVHPSLHVEPPASPRWNLALATRVGARVQLTDGAWLRAEARGLRWGEQEIDVHGGLWQTTWAAGVSWVP